MSLSILKNTSSIGLNQQTTFSGSGGVEPYTYSVVAGGAGGTIDASSGVYTAPAVSGIDTIRVTDSDLVPATADTTINVRNYLGLLCDIIQTELGLADGRVYLFNEKINKPTDDGLFIPIVVHSVKPFSNTRRMTSSGDQSFQYANFKAMISINIISKGHSARDRKEEVLLALNSVYSQQQQELNSFYIAPLSGQFNNLSEEDGSAIPFRFVTDIVMHYQVSKTKSVSYYDTFEDVGITTNK